MLRKNIRRRRGGQPIESARTGTEVARDINRRLHASRNSLAGNRSKTINLRVISAKVQTAIIGNRKPKSRRGTEKGEPVEKARRFRLPIGTYVEFNDGWTIHGPDGRIHRGRGTVVRFNFRHKTWSVQRPQCCETNRLGYEFTRQGEPCWLKAARESGFTTLDFGRSFSAGFLALCQAGHALAKRNAATMRRRAA